MGYCMVEGIRCCGSFKGHTELYMVRLCRYTFLEVFFGWLTAHVLASVCHHLLFWALTTVTLRDNENAVGRENSSPPVRRYYSFHLRLDNYDVRAVCTKLLYRKHILLYQVRL